MLTKCKILLERRRKKQIWASRKKKETASRGQSNQNDGVWGAEQKRWTWAHKVYRTPWREVPNGHPVESYAGRKEMQRTTTSNPHVQHKISIQPPRGWTQRFIPTCILIKLWAKETILKAWRSDSWPTSDCQEIIIFLIRNFGGQKVVGWYI